MPPETKTPNNLEIDKALKEFEAKSGAEQAQNTPEASKVSEIPCKEMEGIKFDTDSYKTMKFYNETTAPKMVQLVMKWSGGAIKQKQAEYVLLGIAILMFALSFYFFFK